MFDVDGVVIRRPGGRSWDADLEADLGIDPAALGRRFFAVHFGDVVLGRADLFDRLDVVVPALGGISSRELVDYWFARDAHLDERLLNDLGEARARGLDVHLATVQEHHRARYLWDTLGLRRYFASMHYAADVGHVKTEEGFYRVVESRTGLRPAEHCLVDDTQENVSAAEREGWKAVLWTPESRLEHVLGMVTPGIRDGG
ncbi:HAD-IA family hydrolase [Phytoactinopolyspora sp. XMNu-373]|uniref:HAD-IA family hydrolase n=2 Tax=Phytoactinopolyspora mesophila TaxID=2650750 RepID=A0A7K3M7Z5_9ACTN|nr:HAD-IA family hydrolase [Phytoactinopolyspora mesophila]NDL59443.1 HAD-IA family hydrolase [Phytoactinopolyspora mesophila]